jgi:hypothetical protein
LYLALIVLNDSFGVKEVSSMTFISEIHNTLHKKNENYLALFLGKTGSGKSWAALNLAETLDPNFNVDNVVFTAIDFIHLINKDLPKGTCIIFDDAGVGYSNREWWTFSNQLVNMVLQSFRYKNYAVIFTTPVITYIDKVSRPLFHMVFLTKYKDETKEKCYCAPYKWISNPLTGDSYPKKLTIQDQTGGTNNMELLGFDKPSKEIQVAYEAKRDVWNTEVRKNAELKAIDMEAKKTKSLQGYKTNEDSEPKLSEEDVNTVNKFIDYVPKDVRNALLKEMSNKGKPVKDVILDG